MPNEITDAAARSVKATKALDTMRARIVKADEGAHRGRAPHARHPGRRGRDRGRDRQPRRRRDVSGVLDAARTGLGHRDADTGGLSAP